MTSLIDELSSVERIDDALGAQGRELTKGEEGLSEELYVPRAVEGMPDSGYLSMSFTVIDSRW